MRVAGSLITVCIVLAFGTDAARGGTYEVWTCADPDRLVYDGVAGLAWPPGWRSDGQYFVSGASCGHGPPSTSKSLSVESIGATGGPAGGGWTFAAPPGAQIDRVTVWRDIYLTSPGMRAGFRYGSSEDTCASPCSAGLGGRGVAAGDPFAAQRKIEYSLNYARNAFRMFMACERADGCTGRFDTDYVAVYAIRLTLSDIQPPVLTAAPSGSLLTATQPVSGSQTVDVGATDEGSGIVAFALEADGTELARWPVSNAPTCVAPFNRPQPCPASATGSYGFDTAMLVDGRHSLRVKAIDALGNETPSAPVAVVTHNRTSGCQPSGGGPVIAASLGRSGAAATIPFGRRTTVRGRILDATGQPLPGAQVQVVERQLRAGALPRVTQTIVSDAEGRLRLSLTRGPSREIRFGIPAAGSGLVCSRALRLRVRAGITLSVRPRRVSSNGRIIFSGRLRGRPRAKGVQVAIYAVARRGRERVPVEIVRTGAKGRFVFGYRFRRSFAPFTYRFRARVRQQPGYPYASAWSRKVVVYIVR